MLHLPQIDYQTIPHKQQRYDTAGDYYQCECSKCGVIKLRVSQLEKPEYELLVLIHELYEWFTTTKDGISEESITEFDINGVSPEYEDDPGCDPNAPYHKRHMEAVEIEKFVAKLLGINWKKYDNSFKKLKYD